MGSRVSLLNKDETELFCDILSIACAIRGAIGTIRIFLQFFTSVVSRMESETTKLFICEL